MFAIVETGGKQYKVEPNTVFKVEKLKGKKGDEVLLTKVLAVEKRGELRVGKPYVSGAVVKAEVLEQGKDKKIIVFKYRPKKRIRKKTGHRQCYTKIRVKEIVTSDIV